MFCLEKQHFCWVVNGLEAFRSTHCPVTWSHLKANSSQLFPLGVDQHPNNTGKIPSFGVITSYFLHKIYIWTWSSYLSLHNLSVKCIAINDFVFKLFWIQTSTQQKRSLYSHSIATAEIQWQHYIKYKVTSPPFKTIWLLSHRHVLWGSKIKNDIFE